MNIQEVAEKYKVSPSTVRTWIWRGMPFLKQGGRGISWELDGVAVDEWYRRRILFDGDPFDWDLSALVEDMERWDAEKKLRSRKK